MLPLSTQDLMPNSRSKSHLMVSTSERNEEQLEDMAPTAASVVELAATAQGIPDAVTVEIAIGIKNLTPEQLALVIKASANNGLSDRHLEAVISAAQQALKQRH